ncbi:MAG: ABC transporter ATP-binding protein [Caldilineaceae bacterium SB0670_bin_27]|uniref:ABC transporter ATP-binding protein n=1 Tax=Caldilineaceae bacterium SB0664_bin_27 TaxID=2605260 RepID=A0A6B0YYY0_9CHLR|nr:ABC transporter ATP-binding protein [Caldilineaceae bacterium SB0664_bin_27]MYJ77393.1 ABC transporter ATP-binding protein [Caldilineaceae bacterium SB0670_bin_27]
MKAAIKIESLSKTFRSRGGNEVEAVSRLDLTVEPGQVFGFLGSNGAGKTTTLKMACGLVMPTTGTVQLNGYDVSRQRGQAMQQIGAVLEGTRNVYWRMNAWQNLLYFGRIKGVSASSVLKARAEQLLRELDLWDRRKDPVGEFSRGMQQKVAIGAALISDPPIVLLDEPALGLDVQASRTVQEWIIQLAKERGKTVVLTTHQLDMAESLCDRVAIMSRGRLLTHRPTGELLDLFRREFYQVRLRGLVEAEKTGAFPGFTASQENGHTVLSGEVGEELSVFDLVERARLAGMDLISVTPAEPNLEEIFVEMIERAEETSAKDSGLEQGAGRVSAGVEIRG